MTKLRRSLLLGVLVASALAAAAGYVVVAPLSPDAARTRLYIDLGHAAVLAVVVLVLASPLTRNIADVVEALRALARGERHQRVDPELYGALAEVARATNEVAASMCEGEDPNLGPIRAQKRETPVVLPPTKAPVLVTPVHPRGAVQEHSEHPEIGSVRPRTRIQASEKPERAVGEPRTMRHKTSPSVAQGAPAPAPSTPAPAPSTPAPSTTSAPAPIEAAPRPTARATADEDDGAGPARPAPAASNDTVIEPAATSAEDLPPAAAPMGDNATSDDVVAAPPPDETATPLTMPAAVSANTSANAATTAAPSAASSSSVPATTSTPASEVPPLPTLAEVEVLFASYLSARKQNEKDDGDVELDAFSETVRSEGERLLAAHGCKGVRFDVTVADGEVSLRPRLLR